MLDNKELYFFNELHDHMKRMVNQIHLMEQADSKEDFIIFLEASDEIEQLIDGLFDKWHRDNPIISGRPLYTHTTKMTTLEKIKNKKGDYAKLYSKAKELGVIE